MATATDQELLTMGQNDLKKIFEDYSVEVTFKDEPSYWGDEGKACIAVIKPRYHKNVELHMRIELVDQRPSGRAAHILFGEDNWEEIDAENVWRWLFFYTLDQVKA